ncbi:hypothetical protein CRENBAI_003256 [Crenichthys baileyi]|uniref:Uncharacterized protein n=1 Tax=Crenichthys baileyi TaxID=28760 RepID=A0AAV9RSJ7_9TELE
MGDRHSPPVHRSSTSPSADSWGCEPGVSAVGVDISKMSGTFAVKRYLALSTQDERTPGKEEEIGKDGTVWTVVVEEESRGRRQSQNALTECQIQEAQNAFLCLVDAKMLIHVQGCSVAEARRVLGDDSSSNISVDELKPFLALNVREVKGGRNMELSRFWSD